MLKVKLSLSLFLIIIPTFLFSQTDTTYFDVSWNKTNNNNAKYFRLPPLKTDSGYLIKDYYLSGKLQMEGISTSLDEDIFNGKIIWYYENNQINQIANYNTGYLEGLFQVYNESGEKLSEGIYKENYPIEGTFTEINKSYNINKKYKNGELIEMDIYSTDKRSKAKFEIFLKNNKYEAIKFYDQNGKFIGETNEIDEDEKIINGFYVSYAMNPMMVSRTATYKNRKLMNPATEYFSNGKPKLLEYLDSENMLQKRVYFTNDSKTTDTVYYNNDYPINGTEITYYNSEENSFDADYIESITNYKNGSYYKETKEYYKENRLKKITKYDINGNENEVTFYNTKGKVIGKLYSDENQNLTGTKYEFDINDSIKEITVYKNNEVIKSKKINDGKILFDIDYSGKSTFYNPLDNKEYNCLYKDNAPFEGTEILYDSYNNFITEINSYKNGKLNGIKLSLSYNSERDTNELYLEENYKEGIKEGIEKTYNQGVILKKINYINGLKEGEAYFYNKNGKGYGKSYYKKDQPFEGYFIDMDDNATVNSISKYKNGLLQDTIFTFSDDTCISMDLYNLGELRESITFDYSGKKHILIYKNNEPFEGSKMEYNKETIYKEGDLIAKYEYNYDFQLKSKEEINGTESIYTEYYEDGKIRTIFHKTTDQLNGKCQTYRKNGVLLSEGIYKEDKPSEGKFIFFSTEDENKYVEVTLNNSLYKAIEINNNKQIKELELKVNITTEDTNDLENFIESLEIYFKNYKFLSGNSIY